MEIRDEHILITGANRGIGLAIAQALAGEGAHLHLHMRKAEPEIAEEMVKRGALSATIHTGDLSHYEGVESFWQSFSEQQVPLGVLINNAGQLTGGLVEEQDTREIYQMMHVNLLALIHLTQKAIPIMLKRKRGKIVNNASVSGIMHLPCASTYTAAKSGVVAFTESIKQELRGTGVSTLLLVTPGIKTRMFDEIEKRYSKNFDVTGLKSIEASKWAELVKEAIFEDVEELRPDGLTAAALRIAQFAPKILELGVKAKFKRGDS